MSIDGRAYAWCNLGPLAEGTSSIADSHVQGSGVITVKGTINLAGVYRPAPGTVVELAYSDGQNWIARIPRRLRVLSSFANPLGGKLTSVSVGCDLAYYDNRKQPPSSLTTRQANPDTPEAVWRAAAPSIPASWLVGQILSALGLSVSGSIPLTNQYTRQEFDMTAGYVEELGKLAASEGYAVRMTTAGLVEFIGKDPGLGTSVLLSEEDLIDLNPINTGDLPGDSVYAKYTSLKLVAPSNLSEDELQRRNWELEKSVSAAQRYTHQWTEYQKTPVLNGSGSPTYKQRKDANGRPVFYIQSQSIENGTETTILGDAVLDQVFEVKAYQLKEEITYITVATTRTRYDNKDRVVSRITESQGQWSLDYTETSYRYNSDGDVIEETTVEFSSLGPVKMSIGFQANYATIRGGGFGAQYQSGYREIRYDKDKNSGITKTSTTSLMPFINTPDGSEAISRLRDAGNQLDASRLNQILGIATGLVNAGTEVRIRTEREFGVQKRPSQAELSAAANQKAPTVETTTQATWAVGSAASQTQIELSPPYVPDDRIVASGSVYGVIKSDADQKALNYARIENRLLLGHRNGVGIQVLPEVLPAEPMGLVFIRLNGCTAAFRINGTTYNIDPQGVAATTDCLFWGAIDGAVADAWFPLPPGATSLPSPVAVATNASPRPANAISIPGGFSFTAPNLSSLFASLPAAQAPVFGKTATPGVLVKPYHETIELWAGGGAGAFANPLPWAPQTVPLFAGGGGGAFASISRLLVAGGGAGAFTAAPSSAPMLAFTGGTSLAWSENRIYGYSFTLSSAKQIKGVGVYDAGGDGLQDAISVYVGINFGEYLPYGNDVLEINPGQSGFTGRYIAVAAGTAAPLDGTWRRVSFEGVTLQPGTYGVFAYLTSAATSSCTMIKNATGLTTQSGVTINGPLAYDISSEEAVSTTGDNPAYFGPVLFF
jgi:hypothetical protein